MRKQDVQGIVDQMPEEIDTDELIYQIWLLEKLHNSEAQADSGQLIPHEEVTRGIRPPGVSE